jgi:hypothetical protein
MDFVGRKILLQVTNELLKAPSTLSYRIGERAIEFAMKQELPILGIEAHDVGWQHIDTEIRGELRNAFAIRRKLVSGTACHEVSARVSALALLDRLVTARPFFARHTGASPWKPQTRSLADSSKPGHDVRRLSR